MNFENIFSILLSGQINDDILEYRIKGFEACIKLAMDKAKMDLDIARMQRDTLKIEQEIILEKRKLKELEESEK